VRFHCVQLAGIFCVDLLLLLTRTQTRLTGVDEHPHADDDADDADDVDVDVSPVYTAQTAYTPVQIMHNSRSTA